MLGHRGPGRWPRPRHAECTVRLPLGRYVADGYGDLLQGDDFGYDIWLAYPGPAMTCLISGRCAVLIAWPLDLWRSRFPCGKAPRGGSARFLRSISLVSLCVTSQMS
jgi:hypothetical protein